ncbi:PASTA domain-containing protein [Micromonospora sp. NPDC126480]|uniref:Stk1 family PASTA domain-containing Ser/Thr kinase n=1 Tax=Micromonospora sp. NPDC126480 TaxID=3155312 RepID=UPI003319C6EB
MTDGNTGHGTGSDRMTLVLGGGLATVLLAAVGATAGWVLAGANDDRVDPVATGSATPSAPSVTSGPVRRTTAPATPSRSSPAGVTVPVLVGRDYDDAQKELVKRGLRWRLVFGRGTGREVERSYPAAGATVNPGRTVTLYVSGPPPVVRVPDVTGDDCAEAAEELADEGLKVVYTLRRSGSVLKQEPTGGGQAPWGDPVALWCGDAADGADPPTANP